MGLEISSGPYVITGNTNVQQNTESTDAGPSVTFQGDAVLDPRYVGTIGTATSVPQNLIYGHFNHAYMCAVDAQPTAPNTGRLFASAAPPVVPAGGSIAFTLTTAHATGVNVSVPVIPQGSAINSTNVVSTIALDFGFSTMTMVSASSTVTIPAGDGKYYQVGGKYIVCNTTSTTAPQVITVATLPTTPQGTSMTIVETANFSVTSGRVGTAYPGIGLAAWPWRKTGATAMLNPYETVARCVSTTSAGAGGTGYTVLFRGYDIYGQPMAERVAVANSAATTNGTKAFKYIVSATFEKSGGGTFSQNVALGTTDIFGLNYRSDFWEYMNIYQNGAFVTASTGYTAAVATSPATATTGDVRGTYTVQSASDGTKRLAVFMTMPLYELTKSTNLDYQSLFGVTQYTT